MHILDTIVAQKKIEAARLPARAITDSVLAAALQKRGDRRDFFAALQHPPRGSMALIAEVKKASPWAGVICPDFDPVRIAREYRRPGRPACRS